MSESISDLAIEIMRSTKDGDNLAPQHLKLVERAVNGFLNEQGEVEFYELVSNVRKGYVKPWFHDIENLTIDHAGYVYWKDKQVEHYTPRWAYTDDAKQAATELARRCRHLESIGAEVNGTNAVWKWEQFVESRNEEAEGPAR
jgi:hypothetical protein